MQKGILKNPYYSSLFLFAITFGIYYCSVVLVLFNPDPLIVEDKKILSALTNGALNLDAILRFSSSGKYLRPVTDFSYYMDYLAWGGDPFGFRMTSLIIHAVNVVLCYQMLTLLLKNSERMHEVAFFSALLFAVHPSSVESISWISGRADPLALFFSLLGLIFYFLAKVKSRWPLVIIAFFFISLSLLSKETGLATLIVIVAFEGYYSRSFGYIRWTYSAPLLLFLMLAIPASFMIRAYVMPGSDIGSRLVTGAIMDKEIFNTIMPFLASYGFYLKKTVYPFPLNFTINEINIPLYATMGTIVFVSYVSLFRKAYFDKGSFYFFWAIITLSPAALISFTDIAWTRWAERYMYFSLVPLSLASTDALFSVAAASKKNYKKIVIIFLSSFCFIFSIATLGRSNLFSSNENILYDSYKKSPGFLPINLVYAHVLINSTKYEEAKEVLLNAEKLRGAKHQLHFSLGQLFQMEGNYEQAEDYYQTALMEARSDRSLVTMGRTLRKDILVALSGLEIMKHIAREKEEETNIHYSKAAELMIKAYEEAPDPFLLYRLAKIYLKSKDYETTKIYLKKFISKSKGNYYQDIANKMLINLENDLYN